MQTVVTDVFNPQPEVQSEEEISNYASKLGKLTQSERCIELSNVMAAKHNQTSQPTALSEHAAKHLVVTDLNTKATLLCISAFGAEIIDKYSGQDNFERLVTLINSVDEELAQHELTPLEHGTKLLNRVSVELGQR